MRILQIYATHIKENVMRLYNENKNKIKDLNPNMDKIKNDSLNLQRQLNDTTSAFTNMINTLTLKEKAFEDKMESLRDEINAQISNLEHNSASNTHTLDHLKTNFSEKLIELTDQLNGMNGSLWELKSTQIDFNADIRNKVAVNERQYFAVKGSLEGSTGINGNIQSLSFQTKVDLDLFADEKFNETNNKIARLQTTLEALNSSSSQSKITSLENDIKTYKSKQNTMEDIFNATIKNWTDSQRHNTDLDFKLQELESKLTHLESRMHDLTFKTIGDLGDFYLIPNVHTYDEGSAICSTHQAHLIEFTEGDLKPKLRQIVSTLGLKVDFYIGLNDKENEGSWIWEHSNTTLASFAGVWDEGEPNNLGDEHCAAVRPNRNFLLNDLKCSRKLPIVCQKSLTSLLPDF